MSSERYIKLRALAALAGKCAVDRSDWYYQFSLPAEFSQPVRTFILFREAVILIHPHHHQQRRRRRHIPTRAINRAGVKRLFIEEARDVFIPPLDPERCRSERGKYMMMMTVAAEAGAVSAKVHPP